MQNKTILVVGGTGLIGKELCALFISQGHHVKVLSRRTSNPKLNLYQWDPVIGIIDPEALMNVQVIVNLAGEPVAGKRWTPQQKQKITSSRMTSANLLFSKRDQLPLLEQYISASGINAYGFEQGQNVSEVAAYGNDFLAQVVKKWEESANQFSTICTVCKLRIGVVFSKFGGPLEQISLPIKFGIVSALGTGKQNMPWIDSEDLCSVFAHVMNKGLQGEFNTIAGNCTNKELTSVIAKTLKRPLFFPKVPAFVLKLILGEMSEIILKGVHASNQKIADTGFIFNENLNSSLQKNLL